MKKTSKILVTAMLLVMMFFSMSMTAFATDHVMKVGDDYGLQLSDEPYVSSDTSVVEIRDEGNSGYSAVAVGEGVAIVNGGKWMGGKQEEYVFVITNYEGIGADCNRLEVGATHRINMISDTPYMSSDTSVIEIRDEGNSNYSAVAVGDGVAIVNGGSFMGSAYTVTYVFIVGDVESVYGITDSFGDNENNSDENELDDNQNSHQQRVDKIKEKQPAHFANIIIIVVLFIPLLVIAAYSLVSMLKLSATSTKKKTLPAIRVTANTITSSYAPRNTWVVPINGKMTAKNFENTVNEWLAQNPYVYNCKIKFNTKQSLLSPFVNYKFFVKNAVIEYSVATQPRNTQYGWTYLYKYRFFGPVGYSGEKLVAKWLSNNPDCNVVSSQGGRIQHFGNGGFYAEYYEYVFFEKNSTTEFGNKNL